MPSASRRRAIEEGFFTIPDEEGAPPRLLGSRCRACGETFFPRRAVCAKCLALGTEPVELGPRGRLWTWTWCHLPLFGSRRSADDGGYGVGQVDLPEGPRVQCVLAGQRGDFAIGMELVLDLELLGQTKEGEDLVIFRFKPAQAGSQGGEAAAQRAAGERSR